MPDQQESSQRSWEQVPAGQLVADDSQPVEDSQSEPFYEQEERLARAPAPTIARSELSECITVASSWVAKGDLSPELADKIDEWVVNKTMVLSAVEFTSGDCADGVIEFHHWKEDVDADLKSRSSSSGSLPLHPPPLPPPIVPVGTVETTMARELPPPPLPPPPLAVVPECGISDSAPKRRRITGKKKEKKEL